MARALISLGSNLGDRRQTLDEACRDLASTPGIEQVRPSAWYETAPIGGPTEQAPFLNGAALVETSLAPSALLDRLHAVELAHGRRRDIPWGPRTLDLDLLLYDERVLSTPQLTLPHPRLSFRKFVLRGAVEIAGEMRHPHLHATLAELWRHLHEAPRYAAFVGRSPGFRAQFAAEAADAARARLVEPTADGVPAFETLLSADGLTTAHVIEFVAARKRAVSASLADAEADDHWVADDGFIVAEAVQLAGRWPATELGAVMSQLRDGPMPRLIARLDLPGDDRPWTPSIPEVVLDITRREEALVEFAAALDAAS